MIGAVNGGELAIVIEGRREDWPRGARTLTPHDPIQEPNGRTLWFGADLDPDGEPGVVPDHGDGRRPDAGEDTSARGERLVDALLAWLTPNRQLGPEINRFQVRVWQDDDPWIEPYLR